MDWHKTLEMFTESVKGFNISFKANVDIWGACHVPFIPYDVKNTSGIPTENHTDTDHIEQF